MGRDIGVHVRLVYDESPPSTPTIERTNRRMAPDNVTPLSIGKNYTLVPRPGK